MYVYCPQKLCQFSAKSNFPPDKQMKSCQECYQTEFLLESASLAVMWIRSKFHKILCVLENKYLLKKEASFRLFIIVSRGAVLTAAALHWTMLALKFC